MRLLERLKYDGVIDTMGMGGTGQYRFAVLAIRDLINHWC